MSLQTLRDELDAGHPVTGAYSSDPQNATDEINALNRNRIVPISSAELLAWSGQASAGDRPRITKIEEGMQSQNESIAAICKVADATINRDSTQLDLNLPDRVAMVDALVVASILSTDDEASLYAIATQAISRADELGLSNVRPGTIEQARALPAANGDDV